jgi:hypothetical protein
LESTDGYGFSSLNGYQFVSQGILFVLTLLYIYPYIQCLMEPTWFKGTNSLCTNM